MNQGEIGIYQTDDGDTKIDVKFIDETVWLTKAQLCELYQTSKSNISEHITHILEEGELDGENVLIGVGKVSHMQTMNKAKQEYQKYIAQNLSPVEEAYLETIKSVEKKAKKNT